MHNSANNFKAQRCALQTLENTENLSEIKNVGTLGRKRFDLGPENRNFNKSEARTLLKCGFIAIARDCLPYFMYVAEKLILGAKIYNSSQNLTVFGIMKSKDLFGTIKILKLSKLCHFAYSHAECVYTKLIWKARVVIQQK